MSLAFELELQRRVVTALLILGDAIEHDGIERIDHLDEAPGAMVGVLALLAARMQLLKRVVRGDVDPALIIDSENAVGGNADDIGLLLKPWSTAERQRRLADEMKRLERRASARPAKVGK